MKARRIMFMGLLMMAVLSCGKKNPAAPQEDFRGYFPLNVGNKWYFYHPGNPDAKVVYRVWETRELDGKVYSVYGNKAETGDLFRQDERGNIYKKRPVGELLWFNFAAADGGMYEVKLSDNFVYTVTVHKKQAVSYDGRTFNDCVVFYFDAPNLTTEEETFVFAPDVGIVKRENAWMTLLLDTYEFQN